MLSGAMMRAESRNVGKKLSHKYYDDFFASIRISEKRNGYDIVEKILSPKPFVYDSALEERIIKELEEELIETKT